MRTEPSTHRPSDLPNVFVVGAAKAGTTALYHYFRCHPQVYVPEGVKETNYMSFHGGLPPMRGPGDRRFVGRSVCTLDDYTRLYRQRAGQTLAADVSPSYLYYPQAAEHIKQLAPQAKIVIVLRNPVECAFSMYAMMRRDLREPCESFAEAFQSSRQRLSDGWEWAWDYQRGYLFADQVRRYLALFSPQQRLVARYEQLRDQPDTFYRDLTQFLEIEPIDLQRANQHVNTSPRRIDALRRVKFGNLLYRGGRLAGGLLPRHIQNRLKQRLSTPAYALSEADRQILAQHFAADVADLSQLLNWDLSDWLRTETKLVH